MRVHPRVAALALATLALVPAAHATEIELEIVVPEGEMLTGVVPVEAIVRGAGAEAVARVRFDFDGRLTLNRREAPYRIELDLGPLPRPRTLRAVALDAGGDVVAADEVLLNGSPHRFAVRLAAPRDGSRHDGTVEARVEVAVPEGETLARLELFRDDERLAVLERPPFVRALPLAEPGALALIRAVGVSSDGRTAEDVAVINGPAIHDEIAVDLVELYTTVLDRDRRPVSGLERADFRVFEDGREQRLTRFERVRDLPVHAAILLDVSASMAPRLAEARAAAAGFFTALVSPRNGGGDSGDTGDAAGAEDRVAAITFNDRPHLAAPFTRDLAIFADGIAGVRAERGTALYDSLIYALFQLEGLRGQRAVLLLSDGVDESSRFSLEQALEYARRSEATIYAIGIELEGGNRKVLTRFAEETGGRSFFLADLAGLPAVYDAILEELRAKYLLAYQSDAGSAASGAKGSRRRPGGFRRVEVEVEGRGLEAKTIRGYYP